MGASLQWANIKNSDMGINLFGSSSSFDEKPKLRNIFKREKKTQNNSPNPNPENYQIIKHIEINGHLVIMIKYLDCTNYEGNKILLYEDCEQLDLIKQLAIDPHFAENKNYLSPFARFEPTQSGWNAACLMAHNLK